MTSYTFVAPAYWASALINGDTSGLDDSDEAEFEAWCLDNPEDASNVVGCDYETHIGRWNGLLTDLLTYHTLSHEET